MISVKTKRSVVLTTVIILIFSAAGFIFHLFIVYLPGDGNLDQNDLPVTTVDFTEKMYPQMLDLGKFFLTILVGVFVASITFSEKIVTVSSSSWWSKSLLILCWLLLLMSIVFDGVGLVFVSNWYANEVISHEQAHMEMFELAFYAFGLAGIAFGLALTSLLTAGIISYISQINFLTAKK